MSGDENELAAGLGEKLLYSIKSLSEIGEELSTIEELASSGRAVLHLIMGTLVISKAAIMLYDRQSGELYVDTSRGLDDPQMRLRLDPEAARALGSCSEPFRIEEPPAPAIAEYLQAHGEELARLHSHIWIPLRVKRGLLGVVSISKKFMGQDYEAVDLELLSIIARQMSIALNNFLLIRSLKDANFQLNRKILELETLFDLGIAIAGVMDVEELCELILINAVGLTDASSGLLALGDGQTDSSRVAAAINIPDGMLEDIGGFSVLSDVLQSGQPLLDNKADPADNPFRFRKMLFVPLKGQHGVQGIIGLADKESREGGLLDFNEYDQRLLTNFASQAGVAIENAKLYAQALEKERLERELQVAATIQQNLLPYKPPQIPGYEIAAMTKPSRMVGGDHYDFISRDGKHLLSIADVSGKGIPAALLVSTLHATLHALASGDWDLQKMVRRISRSIFESSLSNKFITFVMAILDPEKGQLTSVNAGHNYPLIVSADGGLHTLRAGGMCLGLLPEGKYEREVTELKGGDVVALYTDGVTEMFNPADEEYGEERLIQILQDNRDLGAREIFDAVLADVERFADGAPQHDDLTLVILKVLPV